ncbi:Rap30/74 interaction domain-containing protein [Parathielavia appendiculata]|uniref:Rap30/74 interaction domain-containing protein n=1 Tax=Parathielavia appendiculata TaxID=2587402 RepID=A0AAN6U783_9PEZI|nr:Rap30/74 interaction domain-containing protein [Parathielavia appendiculata]
MSAPPPSAGNAPPRPPGRAQFRPSSTANPLVARKKPRPQPAMARPPKTNNGPGGKGGLADKKKLVLDDPDDPTMRQLAQIRAQNGGWTEKPPEQYTDFPLVMTKRSMLEGLRHHIMRLSNSKGDSSRAKGDAVVDVTNQDQFPRPVTLLRRDPRLPPAYRMAVKEESAPADPAEAAEFERIRQLKAQKEAQRALDQAQIAPVLKGHEPKPKQSNKKEKPTAFYGRNSDVQKKESKIHYEETWPWHLEDAEGKAGVWVGSYIASLSDTNVALVIDGARFRMIPLERYYRFDEKPKFDTLSLDDAEKMMYEIKEIKRWVMKQKDQEQMEREKNETRQFLRGPTRVKTESATSRLARRTERQDDFELDISGDEFQDDDEAPGFEADEDEEAKEAKDRIRREQVSANTFGEGEEDKVEQQEREEQLEKLRSKIIGKQTVKTLKKLEHGLDYDDLESGSDENNPFTDDSDTDEESSDHADKEDEEGKKTDQGASGANTKGDTTPSGKQRTVNALKKGKLKRAGSPNMSESSDNEAARKKLRTGMGSVVASRGGTPIPGRPKQLGAAMSDGEATGGEASDAGTRLKTKLKTKPGVRTGATPSGSRASSPAPTGSQGPKTGTTTPGGSPPPGDRIVPVANQAPKVGAAASGGPDRIQPREIAEALAPYAKEGISLSNLMKMFQKRIGKPGNITKSEWIQMVKAHAVYGADKLLRPKPGNGST